MSSVAACVKDSIWIISGSSTSPLIGNDFEEEDYCRPTVGSRAGVCVDSVTSSARHCRRTQPVRRTKPAGTKQKEQTSEDDCFCPNRLYDFSINIVVVVVTGDSVRSRAVRVHHQPGRNLQNLEFGGISRFSPELCSLGGR